MKKEREERALWAEGTVQRPCGGRGRGEDERLKEPRRSWSTETESEAKMRFKMWASQAGTLKVMSRVFIFI